MNDGIPEYKLMNIIRIIENIEHGEGKKFYTFNWFGFFFWSLIHWFIGSPGKLGRGRGGNLRGTNYNLGTL